MSAISIPSGTKFPWEWEFSGFIASLSIIFLATIHPAVDGVFHLQQLCQILNIPSKHIQTEGRRLQVI